MDALQLLVKQHRDAQQTFEEIAAADDNPALARKLFGTLKAALELHEELEETTPYPRLKEDEQFRNVALESYQEHHLMDVLLREISALTDGSEDFQPKVKALKEITVHHALEEEEGKLFPEIRARWSPDTLQQVRLEMDDVMRQRIGAVRAA